MTENSPRIVVGYDGSADADAALAWAADTARTQKLPIDVVVVASQTDPVAGEFAAHDDEVTDEWQASAQRRLDELGVEDSSVELRRGPVARELIGASAGATMIVVGSTGHGLAAGTLLGSVSQHVVRHATCPVIAVRPQRSPHARRIVVGVDGSPESEKALRFACERASITGESVACIFGYAALSTRMVSLDAAGTGPVARHIEAAHRFVTDICADLATDYPGVEIEPEAIAVKPGQVLVDASTGASLVVVGSRGRGAFAELLLGSTSQHVLHRAECPVAVIR